VEELGEFKVLDGVTKLNEETFGGEEGRGPRCGEELRKSIIGGVPHRCKEGMRGA
jgi:hypothetical protein